MNRKHTSLFFLFLFLGHPILISAQEIVETKNEARSIMSDRYWNLWNPQIQAKIDSGINQYRKANATIVFKTIPVGTKVEIQQIGHSFLFGGNIFLFGDLKTLEKNKKYEDTFGTLFNAATIPFYWKTLEPEESKPRYEKDSPYEYRRPATDPVVEFCESKGINMNGHAIIYGMRRWGHPTWLPDNPKKMEGYFEEHVKELANRYGDRIQRWDVVNESIDQANRGVMPDDYAYKTFSWAMKYFPNSVKFNINDCDIHWGPSRRYVEIIRDLIDRGIRIDYSGVQMHIFNPKESKEIAEGKDILSPEKNYAVLDCLSNAERPIHISEVTVSAPDDTQIGKLIQAEIVKNLYRLWFSYPTVMGITWWNVVDGGAAPGEPSISGLFTTEMKEKPVYHVLDKLINQEWRTNIQVRVDKQKKINYRGFKGKYLVSWKDNKGKTHTKEFSLEKEGDSFEL
ncbi:endo-1,4-beta-xylanase [Massilibacteroides sp.]|uniref:endo-1,4-beta-xylanase n=1 Tax=Massilibacteroides sp. TaxID=2034766 RepID=UPI002605654D|nr:endo-1,4-beta-xylanase [Massilibacteroides sp.]MDD4515499.1 endo-1,4-beta-xylanase [Massilibacteroides sp.]